MSVWNAVLQATHSALIDELNARYPDDKLELGLPKRFEGWALSPNSEFVLLREIVADGGTGLAALGGLESQKKAETEAVMEGTIARATKEFKIRAIDARFGKALAKAPKLVMTIWLPIRIPARKDSPVFDLAIGVSA
jgi:hypothetical protein